MGCRFLQVPLLMSRALSPPSGRSTHPPSPMYVLPLFVVALQCMNLRLQTVSSLLKAKPTYVTVGDIQALPYADELGL